jgi:hypothetical protein
LAGVVPPATGLAGSLSVYVPLEACLIRPLLSLDDDIRRRYLIIISQFIYVAITIVMVIIIVTMAM